MSELFKNWNDIAHRGIHNEFVPENSIESFKIASNQQYSIELDIHMLKDNQIIVFHDNNLKRMTKIDKEIKNCTYEELKKIKLLNSNETIPLFNDVLKTVNGKVPILIEIKIDKKIIKFLKKTFKLLKKYDGVYYFQTFNFRTIIIFKLFRKNQKIGLLVSSNQNKMYYVFVKFFIKIFKPDFLSYPLKRKNDKILKKYKNPIIMWTIRNEKDYHKAEKYAKKIIFE